MIVGIYFEGDKNDLLKWVQHDSYGEALGYLYRMAVNHYLEDIRYTWQFPDFVPIIRCQYSGLMYQAYSATMYQRYSARMYQFSSGCALKIM